MTDLPPTSPKSFGDLPLDEQLQELSTINSTGAPFRGKLWQLLNIRKEVASGEHTIPGYSTEQSLNIIDRIVGGTPTGNNNVTQSNQQTNGRFRRRGNRNIFLIIVVSFTLLRLIFYIVAATGH